MKSYMANAQTAEHNWYVVDATNQVVGRLATQIAKVLQGKHKPVYTAHADTGDFIIVINVEKLIVTGNKATDKVYYEHTGYPGGLKEMQFRHLQERNPEKILKKAIKGMMPKNILAREMVQKLKIYRGNEHPHEAQQPQNLILTKEKGKE